MVPETVEVLPDVRENLEVLHENFEMHPETVEVPPDVRENLEVLHEDFEMQPDAHGNCVGPLPPSPHLEVSGRKDPVPHLEDLADGPPPLPHLEAPAYSWTSQTLHVQCQWSGAAHTQSSWREEEHFHSSTTESLLQHENPFTQARSTRSTTPTFSRPWT